MAHVGRGLRARDAETRAAAVEALETLGQKELAKEIIPLLEDSPSPEGDTTALTLVDALGNLLAEDSGWVRAVAARVVGELDLRALIAELQRLYGTDDTVTHEAAHDALSALKEVEAMETLQTISSLERVLILREIPLFAELPPEDLKRIADIAHEEFYGDGSELVVQGDEGDEMYVIVDGQVRVIRQEEGEEEHLLATRSTGDFIGEMAIIESEPRFATVRAAGDVRVLVIDAGAFDAILRDRPDVTRALLRGMSRRIREMSN